MIFSSTWYFRKCVFPLLTSTNSTVIFSSALLPLVFCSTSRMCTSCLASLVYLLSQFLSSHASTFSLWVLQSHFQVVFFVWLFCFICLFLPPFLCRCSFEIYFFLQKGRFIAACLWPCELLWHSLFFCKYKWLICTICLKDTLCINSYTYKKPQKSVRGKMYHKS